MQKLPLTMRALSAKGKARPISALIHPIRPRGKSAAKEVTPMKFFVDTADVAEIRELAALGLLDGVADDRA